MKRTVVVMVVVLMIAAVGCQKKYDFDGDLKADLVVVEANGTWRRHFLLSSGNPNPAPVLLYTGNATDRVVPADYDGNGTTDVAVVTSSGDWVTQSSVGTFNFPAPPELPAFPNTYGHVVSPFTVDLDGDLKAEAAWFREADATWFVRGRAPIVFGTPSTVPTLTPGHPGNDNADQDTAVPADYDGDGKTDLAVYNPRTRVWRVKSSRDGAVTSVTMAGDKSSVGFPVPGDYDGVGHAQRALFVTSQGWIIDGHATADPYGASADLNLDNLSFPAAADFDGDGKVDLAYLGSDGVWHFKGAPPSFDTIKVGPGNHVYNLPVEFGGALAIERFARFALVAHNCQPGSFNYPNDC